MLTGLQIRVNNPTCYEDFKPLSLFEYSRHRTVVPTVVKIKRPCNLQEKPEYYRYIKAHGGI